jgi:hypothetical protein
VAVDNLLEKLIQAPSDPTQSMPGAPLPRPLRVVRVGHPSRVLETSLPYTLDVLVEGFASKDARSLRKTLSRLHRDYRQLLSQSAHSASSLSQAHGYISKPDKAKARADAAQRYELRDEIKGVAKELSALESAATRHII